MRALDGLRARMTAVCAAATTLVLVGMAAAAYSFSAGQLRAQESMRFNTTVNAVLSHLQQQQVITHTWLLQTEAAAGVWVGLESGGGARLLLTRMPPRDTVIPLAMEAARNEHHFRLSSWSADQEPLYFSLDADAGRYRVAVASVTAGDNRLAVVIAGDRRTELGQLAALRNRFATAVVIAVALLVLFSWGFSAWAVRPALESRRQQTAFVSAASHEFRSPVAVIQMAAESLDRAPPEKAVRFRDMILRECGRLRRLTEDMLQLAGADAGTLSLRPAPVNPEAPLLSTYESYTPLAQEKELHLELCLPAAPLSTVLCDRERIEQILAALVDNALSYTPARGMITLELAEQGRTVVFRVADTGPGVPDDHKTRIFQRFYRGDGARAGKAHYGLGLAVARELAQLHGGSLTVADGEGGGSVFSLALPAVEGDGGRN